MASEAQTAFLPAPYEGVDFSVNPYELPRNKAFRLRNFLVHEQGRCLARGPIIYDVAVGTPAGGTENHIVSWVPTAGDRALVGRVNRGSGATGDTERFWPHRAFDLAIFSSGSILDALQPMLLTLPTGSTLGGQTAQAALGDFLPLFSYASYLGYAFAVSWKETDSTTTGWNGRSFYLTRIAQIEPNGVPSQLSQGPRIVAAVAAFAERLFALGGTAPTTPSTASSHDPSALYWTNPGLAGNTLTDWQLVPGTDNKLVVGDSTKDWGQTLHTVGSRLIIGKRRSIWVLTGDGESSFALKQLSATVGVTDPRGAVVVDDVLYFLYDDGMYACDGTSVERVSRPIDAMLSPALQPHASTGANSGAVLSLQYLGNGYINVFIGEDHHNGQAFAYNAFNYLYHVPTGRWTEFSTNLWQSSQAFMSGYKGGLNVVINLGDHPRPTYQHYLFNAQYIVNPDKVSHESLSSLRMWDYDTTSTRRLIDLQAVLAPLRAGVAGRKIRLLRVMPEYVWLKAQVGTTTDNLRVAAFTYLRQNAGTPGTAVTPKTLLAATALDYYYLGSFNFPGSSIENYSTDDPAPSVDVVEVMSESDDVLIELAREPSATYNASHYIYEGAIHGVTVEYQLTAPRR